VAAAAAVVLVLVPLVPVPVLVPVLAPCYWRRRGRRLKDKRQRRRA
jgi:hypothetical protein